MSSKILYLDCGMGAAGDMLTAALLDMLAEDERRTFVEAFNSVGIPEVVMTSESSVKCGITGTHVTIKVHGNEEDEHLHEHENHHEHAHTHTHADGSSHSHSHNGTAEIRHIVNDHLTGISDKVREDILKVYDIIAEAESKVHGVPVTDIHFHEVGTMDALADITAVCMLMEGIGADQVIASPVNTGSGTVKCAHGILPVPAPATANILIGIPAYSNGIQSELCTPTGAALLRYFVTRFGDMPIMAAQAIGYGMGKKDFPVLNAVRILLGEEAGMTDKIVELEMNLDDMSPERIGFACDRFFELGAVEVYTTPVYMKKSRPGVVLTVMVREDKRDEMVRAIFKYTTTLGIRENVSKRYALKREIVSVDTPFGEIHKKQSTGYGVEREKYEYDDLAAIAHGEGISIDEVIRALEKKEGTHIEREEEDL